MKNLVVRSSCDFFEPASCWKIHTVRTSNKTIILDFFLFLHLIVYYDFRGHLSISYHFFLFLLFSLTLFLFNIENPSLTRLYFVVLQKPISAWLSHLLQKDDAIKTTTLITEIPGQSQINHVCYDSLSGPCGQTVLCIWLIS